MINSIYFIVPAVIFILYLLRKFFKGGRTKRTSIEGKTIIITGSSDGIGKETAFNLLEDGATVIFACRDKEKTMKVIEETKNLKNGKECFKRSFFIQLDLASFKSVDSFINEFKSKFNILDILINNAGYSTAVYKETEDGLEAMSQTNHFSHVRLTLGLLDYFNKNEGRILNISSMAHAYSNFEKTIKTNFSKAKGHNQYKDSFSIVNIWTVYGNTKLANIYFTSYLTKKFESEKKYSHLHAYSVHPGAVSTGFLGVLSKDKTILKIFQSFFKILIIPFLFKNLNDGAQTHLHLCYRDVKDLKDGGYYKDCKLSEPAKIAKNEEICNYLMEETLKIIKN